MSEQDVKPKTKLAEPVQPFEIDEKAERKLEGWKRYLAYAYILINIMDFVIMPFMYEWNKDDFSVVAPLLSQLTPEAQMIVLNSTQWEPLTMMNSAFFHIAMGTILTGVAVFNNRFGNAPVAKK